MSVITMSEITWGILRSSPTNSKEGFVNSCFVAQAAVWGILQDICTFTAGFQSTNNFCFKIFKLAIASLCSSVQQSALQEIWPLGKHTAYLKLSHHSKHFFSLKLNFKILITRDLSSDLGIKSAESSMKQQWHRKAKIISF